jgi:hypothetical protein
MTNAPRQICHCGRTAVMTNGECLPCWSERYAYDRRSMISYAAKLAAISFAISSIVAIWRFIL